MILEDLQYIFKPQIEEGTTKLYFMLIDDNHKIIERHPADDLEGLLPLLNHFQYANSYIMPRFVK